MTFLLLRFFLRYYQFCCFGFFSSISLSEQGICDLEFVIVLRNRRSLLSYRSFLACFLLLPQNLKPEKNLITQLRNHDQKT